MCGTLWFFITFSVSLHLGDIQKKVLGGELIVTPLGIRPNRVCPFLLSFLLPSSVHNSFFFSLSRWEGFRVLPPAKSLTNVALKCNEVWNGSCGYNYPRTWAVSGMISLSLAIRISYERGWKRWKDWMTGSDSAEFYGLVCRLESKKSDPFILCGKKSIWQSPFCKFSYLKRYFFSVMFIICSLQLWETECKKMNPGNHIAGVLKNLLVK